MDSAERHAHDDGMPDLETLIQRHRDLTGESYEQMARRGDGVVSAANLQRYATKQRQFPRDVGTFNALARILRVDVTTVVLAIAKSFGLDVRRHGPRLAQLLPSGADELTTEEEQIVVQMVELFLAKKSRATMSSDEAARVARMAGEGSAVRATGDAPDVSRRRRSG